MGLNMDQVSSERVCQELRDALRAAVEPGPGAAGGIESIQCRASAALYQLLMDHPVDLRGRCRSCRRPGAVLALRRRLCRVHIKADYWLHQPAEFLHSLLAHELGLTDLPNAHARGTHASNQGNPQTQPLSTRPSRPYSLPDEIHRAGRPDADHGGAGVHPDPRPRRVLLDGAGSSEQRAYQVLTGGVSGQICAAGVLDGD
ncbi:MAG: hypothetical protein ACRDTA_15110 [Pseudonocardiaceae bacterium]